MPANALSKIRHLLPGLALTLVLASAAWWLHKLPRVSAISTLMLAILLGMIVRNTAASRPPGSRESDSECGGPAL